MTMERDSAQETENSVGVLEDSATKRLWGEDADREAAKQLGLDDTHTIVMMSTEIDYLDDVREAVQEFEESGLCSPEEVVDAIEGKIVHIPLPHGMVLVAMAPLGVFEPRTYGLVTLTEKTGDDSAPN